MWSDLLSNLVASAEREPDGAGGRRVREYLEGRVTDYLEAFFGR